MSLAFGSSGLGAPALAGAAAASVLALAPADVSAGLAVFALLVLPVSIALGARSHDPELRSLHWIFLGAVLVRAAVAVAVAYGSSANFFALDDHRYSQIGWQLAQAWAGDAPYPSSLFGAAGYYRWNAVLFTLVGNVPLAPALANAAIGGWAVVLAYRIAQDVAGPRAARSAALLTAFWPSLVLWASLNLKDAIAILAILLLLRGGQRLRAGLSPTGLALVAAGLGVLGQLRGYLVFVAGAALALSWVLPKLRAAPVATGALLAGAGLLLPILGPLEDLTLDQTLQTLDQARSELATGNSAYHGQADVSTAAGALRFLPIGLAYFLLAPAPWQLFNARQILTLPEMLAWYALLPMVVLGLVASLRERFATALPVATFALFTTLSYALVEGNLGTAYRHRAQVLVPMLIFAAVGLTKRRAWRADRSLAVVAPGVPS